MSEKTIRYNITLKGYPKLAPVATVRKRDEAYLITMRLNGRSRGEELYKVEKIVEDR